MNLRRSNQLTINNTGIMKNLFLSIVAAFILMSASAQKFEQLAKTPPMGWNSWNKFGCNVSEKLLMGMADAMVSSGMMAAGYQYIVIDDCWQVGRETNGEIKVDKDRFPHGMKFLADYIHSKGLKFGIYSCAGTKTCAGRPGGYGYEFQDAKTYASWGVDYLKYDWCNTENQDARISYTTMRDALYAAGRPIVFSLCEWGTAKPWEWAKEVGHLWRTTEDILDRWDAMIAILDKERDIAKYSGPGFWNDPDMLEVGNSGMTTEEYKTHFSLWCMLAAPLMAGNDLQNMSSETGEILKNAEVIALDQDVLGKQGFCYRDNGDYEIWIKKLANDEKAACLLNRGDEEKEVQVNLNVLLIATDDYWTPDTYKLEDYKVRDLWEHKELKPESSIFNIKLPPHSVKVYRLMKK
jgi:alpha-galactosidase